ncbi:MAG: hypothetical protein OES24_16910 [Acidimicrobiia bacterium]|nr:hypothetical protein [Acidimicrobiia bacterium]
MRQDLQFKKAGRLLFPLVLAVVVAACGGSADAGTEVATLSGESTASADDGTVAPDVDSSQALLDFAACMRDNGVDMADPTFDADGNVQGFGPGGGGGAAGQGLDPRSDEFQTAIGMCGDLLEGADFGGPGGRRGFDREAIQAAFTEFTACLRDEGLQVDDITFGGPGGGPGAGGGQPPADGGGGFAGGPPQPGDGDSPGDGNGPGPGGEGFNPIDAIIRQLDLDEEDPAVTAAVETCQPLIETAFDPASGDTGS